MLGAYGTIHTASRYAMRPGTPCQAACIILLRLWYEPIDCEFIRPVTSDRNLALMSVLCPNSRALSPQFRRM